MIAAVLFNFAHCLEYPEFFGEQRQWQGKNALTGLNCRGYRI
jgi:hypothetical protein